jgi:hypothetical protein
MKRRYLGMAFVIGYILLLVVMFTMCCCTTNQEVGQLVSGSSVREISAPKVELSTNAEIPPIPETSTTTTTVMDESSKNHNVFICYFFVSDKITTNSQYASVKLSWAIENCDENLTRLDDHWVMPIGYEWVQVSVGVETPFRLVAHGLDGSLDIRLIQVLAR